MYLYETNSSVLSKNNENVADFLHKTLVRLKMERIERTWQFFAFYIDKKNCILSRKLEVARVIGHALNYPTDISQDLYLFRARYTIDQMENDLVLDDTRR